MVWKFIKTCQKNRFLKKTPILYTGKMAHFSPWFSMGDFFLKIFAKKVRLSHIFLKNDWLHDGYKVKV